MDSRPHKRARLSPNRDDGPASIRAKRAAFLTSISRSISPPLPLSSRSHTANPQPAATVIDARDAADPQITHTTSPRPIVASTRANKTQQLASKPTTPAASSTLKLIPSPFKLTTIRDLPAAKNVDAISLHDILGNPLVKEAWIFNYCFDVDWLMGFFDADILHQIKVKIIHGSWRNDDPKKRAIDDALSKWKGSVEAVTAYLPDQFGTHHSKMFILFTHDDQAQVVIHTANMIAQDWTNLTQAAWVSPMLSLVDEKTTTSVGKIGSGSRFKHDLLVYLKAYGSKTARLRDQLVNFDFGSVRGALIASAPSHMKESLTTRTDEELWVRTLWGYPSLYRCLSAILPRQEQKPSSHVVCQVSSVATLPQKWLDQFCPVLYDAPYSDSTPKEWDPSRVSIIYPTPGNVASSLNGYASGGSIHMKAQSSIHLKQIASLRPTLCQWTQGPQALARAGRDEAAPHVKTFVSYSAQPTKCEPVQAIQWALLTSANLSQQAWGTMRDTGKGKLKEKEVVVQSYEIGVLVWPELFAEDFDTGEGGEQSDTDLHSREASVKMIPVFGSDMPSPSDIISASDVASPTRTVVGMRLPYDLPLTPYRADEMPWSPQGTYSAPDRRGGQWT